MFNFQKTERSVNGWTEQKRIHKIFKSLSFNALKQQSYLTLLFEKSHEQ